MTIDHLAEFARRGQAAQRAVDELGAGRPCYWWHVRMRVISRDVTHVETVHAADAKDAARLATTNAAEKWRGCTFHVLDLVQEGL
jgi:hypothetical protein